MRERQIFIKNLVVNAYIGVYAHEKEKPQPLRINLTCFQKDKIPFRSQKLADVICYEQLRKKITGVIAAQHVPLLETLGDTIAAACLEDKRITRLVLGLEKPGIFPDVESCGVTIERKQGDYR
jgi:dihydroneopterin aldolase